MRVAGGLCPLGRGYASHPPEEAEEEEEEEQEEDERERERARVSE